MLLSNALRQRAERGELAGGERSLEGGDSVQETQIDSKAFAIRARGEVLRFAGLRNLGEKNPLGSHSRPGVRQALGIERTLGRLARSSHSLVVVNWHGAKRSSSCV